jgi:hypothetical protein
MYAYRQNGMLILVCPLEKSAWACAALALGLKASNRPSAARIACDVEDAERKLVDAAMPGQPDAAGVAPRWLCHSGRRAGSSVGFNKVAQQYSASSGAVPSAGAGRSRRHRSRASKKTVMLER